jgi:hypothetical protein
MMARGPTNTNRPRAGIRPTTRQSEAASRASLLEEEPRSSPILSLRGTNRSGLGTRQIEVRAHPRKEQPC